MRIGILSPSGGWFYPEAKIGDRIKIGDILAKIENQGAFQKIKSPLAGTVEEILGAGTPLVRGQRIITASDLPIN